MDERGELTDDDRRVAAERSGLPEATVYGVSHLLRRPARAARRAPRARLHRHGLLRRDRRRARRRAPRRPRPRARRAQRRRRGLARRDRLPRLLPLRRRRSATATSSTPGPGVVERVLAGTTRRAAEPRAGAACSTSRCSPAPATGPACAARSHAVARGAARGGQGGRASAAAAAPASRPGTKWEFAARAPRRREVHRRQRRRGRPRLLHRQVPDGAQPGAAARGHGARRLRGRRRARLRPRALRVPAAPSPRSTPRSRRAREHGLLGEDILGTGSRFDVTIVEGAGSYVVGEETALLACLQGLRGTVSARPPFPAAARRVRPADGRQQRRDAVQHPVHRRATAPTPTARSARARRRAPSSSASTSASRARASTRSPSA